MLKFSYIHVYAWEDFIVNAIAAGAKVISEKHHPS